MDKVVRKVPLSTLVVHSSAVTFRAVQQKLIIFVKAPRPGFVKTRLASEIGAEKACAAYVKLVTTLLNRLGALEHVELRFTPDDAVTEIARWMRSTWTAAPQGSGDLGARLSRAFDEAFAQGFNRVTIIGS